MPRDRRSAVGHRHPAAPLQINRENNKADARSNTREKKKHPYGNVSIRARKSTSVLSGRVDVRFTRRRVVLANISSAPDRRGRSR